MRMSDNDEFGLGGMDDDFGGDAGYDFPQDKYTPQGPFEAAGGNGNGNGAHQQTYTPPPQPGPGGQGVGGQTPPGMGDFMTTPVYQEAVHRAGMGQVDAKAERWKGVGMAALLLLAGYGLYRFFQDRR